MFLVSSTTPPLDALYELPPAVPKGGVVLLTKNMAIDYGPDRKSTRLNSSHITSSYAVFCLKKKKRLVFAPCRRCFPLPSSPGSALPARPEPIRPLLVLLGLCDAAPCVTLGLSYSCTVLSHG